VATTTASSVAATTSPPPTTRPTTYVVQPGDSLAAIAARFGISRAALIFVNGIADPDKILAGQRLKIPPATTTTPATASTVPPSTVAPTTVGADPH